MKKSKTKHLICTLCERSFFSGAIVLLNSLLQGGFEGDFHLGYRNVNDAMHQRFQNEIEQFHQTADSNATVYLHRVSTDQHLANYKPTFLRTILGDTDAEEIAGAWYFDPDIVVKTKWRDFEQWIPFGVALCEDVNSPVYASHPRRHQWKQFLEDHDTDYWRNLDIYVNSGFIGARPQHFSFFERWEKIIGWMERHYDAPDYTRTSVKLIGESSSPNTPFYHLDQDCLNAALSCGTEPYSIVGKEGMDFKHGGQWMSHAVGASKPWNASFIRRSLRGKGVRMTDELYWRCADNPFTAHTQVEISRAKLRMKTARALHRLL